MPKMLEGDVLDPEDEVVRLLKRELADVRRELEEERAAGSRKESQALAAIKALRKTFLPMYRTLQVVFGEIDAVVTEAESAGVSSSQPSDRIRNHWATWQQKFGHGSLSSRFIGALLEHGPLDSSQMRAAARMGTQSVYDTFNKLKKLALVEKTGSKYSLTQL